jgi:CheY-like chemotaxis protein
MPPTVGIVGVDDALRISLPVLLEAAGYRTRTFRSSAELLQAEIQGITCLILDNFMPFVTGLELAEILRASGSSIPIFLITGSPTLNVLRRAKRAGINGLLQRPLDIENLNSLANANRFRIRNKKQADAGPFTLTQAKQALPDLPVFLRDHAHAAGTVVNPEVDSSEWDDNRRNIEIFLCGQFPLIQHPKPKQTARNQTANCDPPVVPLQYKSFSFR